jgi:hypothetical protein
VNASSDAHCVMTRQTSELRRDLDNLNTAAGSTSKG